LVIAAASQSQKEIKLRYLHNAATKVDLLRLLIRLAKDTNCLTQKQYIELEGSLNQVGKMLGGWIKSF
jgi:hypothetical protein